MPDLTEIFPAILGVGGVLFTVLVNTVFTMIHNRIDFNNKRFFDAHNRRLTVYEEVIGGLDTMMKKQDSNTIIQLSGIDMSNVIIDSLHTLDILKARLMLYGSLGSAGVLKLLADRIAPMQDEALKVPFNTPGGSTISDIYIHYLRNVDAALHSFILLASEETGKNLVDKKIMKGSKKVTKKFTNRVKCQDNKVDNNLKGDKCGPDQGIAGKD
jgi:hypothetical protein